MFLIHLLWLIFVPFFFAIFRYEKKCSKIELEEENKEFFISNYFKFVMEKILARFDMGSDAAEEEIKRCFDAMKGMQKQHQMNYRKFRIKTGRFFEIAGRTKRRSARKARQNRRSDGALCRQRA